MKPKYSTGYLTPQANRRRIPTPTRSESNDEFNALTNVNDSFFEKLMSCPVKRQFILNLLSSDKENVKVYQQKQVEERKRKELNGSPLSKVQKKYQCESPTALLRRRALEQRARKSSGSENQSDVGGSRSSSRQSISSSCASPVPFDQLLDGVIAYVEVRSKDKDQDRSSGAKALMHSMGAVVRDQLAKDVTHVVFKDGSFSTYQKAKLMKVHLVSVLWIEAVRSSNMRVPESRFPALGTEAYDYNVSSLCSQMQKDYEDIIREEMRRSLATGTPLPSRKSMINRRRTIMTPLPSTSNQLSQEFPSTQDREVEQIITSGRKSSSSISLKLSPQLTSDDDSDLSPCINGSIINRRKHFAEDEVILNSIENLQEPTSMELTYIENSQPLIISGGVREENERICENNKVLNQDLIIDESGCESSEKNNVDNSIYNKRTPKLKSGKTPKENAQQKLSQDGFSIPDENLYRRRTRQLKLSIDTSSDNSTSQIKSRNSISSNITPSQLFRKSSHLEILSKNSCNAISTILEVQMENCSTSLSSLKLSSEKHSCEEVSTSTNMSSLHVSSDSNKERCKVNLFNETHNVDKSTSTNMSSLHISLQSDERKRKQDKISDKSTSTNMSALLISSDSSKCQTSADVQICNNNRMDQDHEPKKTSSKAQDKSFNSTGDNSFSPINANTIREVLQVLQDTSRSDENVTKRRPGRPRKSILPSNSDGNEKSKADCSTPLKQSNSDEAVLKTPVNNNDRRKTLRDRVQTIDKNSLLNINRRKTLGAKRKTLLSHNPSTEEGISDEKLLESSPPKILKGTKSSQEVHSDSELSNKNRIFRREKRRTVNKKKESPPENNGKQVNKSTSEESDTSGSDKKRRMRKLYNPDQSVEDIITSDEKEREDKRIEVKNQKSDEGVILNPAIITVASNILLTAKAQEFIEKNQINVQSVLEGDPEESEEDKKSRRRGRKKKIEEKRVSIDSDADEQHKLAEEFINKKKDIPKSSLKKPAPKSEGKIMTRRQSVRLSQHPRKALDFNSSDEKKTIPKTPVKRRSTMEFQALSQRSVKKKLKIDKSKQPTIVCTRMHKDDIQVFYQIVKKLGGFVIEDEVTDRTTHLVAGEPKRTVNMLRAIARGCWVLRHEWLLKSLEEGKWLPEEDFEETDFSCALQKCRLQRQAFGPSFSMDILQDCGPIYIARGSNPRCSDLRELVVLCKGKVVTIPRNASIVVGEYVRQEGVKCVKETWLLDSITFGKKMPFRKYFITPGNISPCA